ncbi:hypothetical protein B296_00052333, partial [Ensete ventricosum]
MASSRAVLGLPVKWRTFGNGALVERRRVFALGYVASSFSSDGERKPLGHLPLVAKWRSSREKISGQAKLRVLETPAVENGQILYGVGIPVTCFENVKPEKEASITDKDGQGDGSSAARAKSSSEKTAENENYPKVSSNCQKLILQQGVHSVAIIAMHVCECYVLL